MSTSGELACTYAIMILHDDGIPITAEKIATLVKKANVQCESYWPGLFAKFTEKKNVEDLITNVSATVGSGAAAVAVSASAGGGAKAVEAPAAEEKKKKEEEKEESDDDGMIMNLFD